MTQWQKNLYTLWAAQFLAMVGLSLVVPFMPLYIGAGRAARRAREPGVLLGSPALLRGTDRL